MKLSTLFSAAVFVSATMLSQAAFAECKTAMGGCLPAEGISDVPSHMRSQIANRVERPKAPVAQTATNKKAANANVALASANKAVKQ